LEVFTLTVREYACLEKITMGAAYLRIWNGKVPGAELIYGRWVIKLQPKEETSQAEREEMATA
jgi:hypothetical protein